MKWITAAHLDAWGRTNSAEPELPELVADLISATASDIRSIRFPSGDKGRTRGLDGILASDGDALFIPKGKSIWEIGTEIDYKGKAIKDFNKRSGEISPADQKDVTLVLVTPFTWDSTKKDWKLENWVEIRKKEQSWKEVIVIDGASLERWLAEAPAVSAWHARNTLKLAPVDAVRSTDEFWNDFANRFAPPLIEEVLTTERESLVEQVLGMLMGPPDQMSLIGDAPDEVIAFAVAAIRSSDEKVRKFLEARTLVIDTEAGGRGLVAKQNLAFLLRGDAARSPGKFSASGPTIVPLDGLQRGGKGQLLGRQTSFALTKALEKMNLSEREAQIYARGCGGSLAALERQIPGGMSELPEWYNNAAVLLPAFLAGSWDSNNAHDQEIMSAIAGTPNYAAFERAIRPFTAGLGSPIACEQSIYKVRAPLDAFIHSGHLIGQDILDQLRPILGKVFGHIDPEPDPEEPAYMRRPPDRHSEWLREGLAATLLLTAVWEEQAGLVVAAGAGQVFANEVVNALPGLKSNHRLLTSLAGNLPMLAEAAPEPFLSALEHMLEGDGEAIRPIFKEVQGFAFPSAEHTNVLWALERLAWDPKLFRRACLILAGLDQIDPGGNLANRPAASLADIFLPWLPSTFAPLSLRIAVMEEILKEFPETGWTLLLRLLPDEQASTSGTDEPRLRGFDVESPRGVTNADYWEAQQHVSGRAIELASGDPLRMLELIRMMFRFPDEALGGAMDALEETLRGAENPERDQLWERLSKEVKHHQKFGYTEWALKGENLERMAKISAEFTPQDPVLQIIDLFDDYWDLDDEDQQKLLRSEAVSKLASEGSPKVIELLSSVRNTYHVLEALIDADLSSAFLAQLVKDSFADDAGDGHSRSLLRVFREMAGDATSISLIEELYQPGVNDVSISRLLCALPSEPQIWDAASKFGETVENSYWQELQPLWTKAERPILLRLMLRLARQGRPIAALETGHNRLKEVPSCLLLALLNRSVHEINKMDSERSSANLDYKIKKVFEELDRRDLADSDIATHEYALLALIEHSKRPLRLHRLMASNADFYHEIVRNVYREETPSKDDDDVEASDTKRSEWRQSYKLLKGFSILPGFVDREPDSSKLTDWIDRMQQLALEHDRQVSTDLSLGNVLAHSPNDDLDGGWPHRFVRDEIERLSSSNVERGLQTERFNMRGVTVRGMRDGGMLERELAADYRRWAEIAELWPRTNSLLSRIAESWERDAEREDSEVRQRELRDTF
ncbi:hypothetical protein [Roseovarius sp. Pro17]|uniref:hypothetical protein n=1 Tax=Roseovarius sp. Pro17 TaxID=3108175 RepID=UPI002D785D37|nr:hypothetical protein [Roseovarius sp. Pro17]